MTTSRACFPLIAATLLCGCLHVRISESATTSTAPLTTLPGISGMALMADGRYLIVIDTKSFSDGLRFGAIDAVAKGGSRFEALPVDGWDRVGGRANDLEAICALAGRDDEFLAAESSYRDADYGRVFHLRVRDGRVELLSAMPLPTERSDGKDEMGYEGLACQHIDAQRYLLVLGERGGSAIRPRGSLRLGEFDASAARITWRDEEIELRAPGNWLAVPPHRDIADLYADADGALWSVAASDPDDYGPFRSLVWKVGQLDGGNPAEPLQLAAQQEARWIIDGFKVEAIAAPDPRIPGSVLSIGSEDEKLGGVWRALGPSP